MFQKYRPKAFNLQSPLKNSIILGTTYYNSQKYILDRDAHGAKCSSESFLQLKIDPKAECARAVTFSRPKASKCDEWQAPYLSFLENRKYKCSPAPFFCVSLPRAISREKNSPWWLIDREEKNGIDRKSLPLPLLHGGPRKDRFKRARSAVNFLFRGQVQQVHATLGSSE